MCLVGYALGLDVPQGILMKKFRWRKSDQYLWINLRLERRMRALDVWGDDKPESYISSNNEIYPYISYAWSSRKVTS